MEIYDRSNLNIIYNINFGEKVIDCGTLRILNINLVLNSGFGLIYLKDISNNLRFPFDVELTFAYL